MKHRQANDIEFSALLSVCRGWYESHNFDNKDWEDHRIHQWLRLHGRDLGSEVFSLPQWAMERYERYRPPGI